MITESKDLAAAEGLLPSPSPRRLRSTKRVAAVCTALAIGAGVTVAVPIALAQGSATRGAAVQAPAGQRAAASQGAQCFGLYPGQSSRAGYQFYYPPGCYGHDEPELDPISSTAGTAQNVTWSVVLPTDSATSGGRQVVDMGPTFWFGAAVKDTHSIVNQAYSELQFYPDASLGSPYCNTNGFFPILSPNTYTVCDFTWGINPTTFNEYAAFAGFLKRTGTTTPMLLHAGDTVTVHYFKGAQTGTPFNITVADTTTGQSGTIVLTGADGPLAPLFSANTTANYLQWGGVQGTPMSLSWEIGHANYTTYPKSPQCVPGEFNCYSYVSATGWGAISPLRVTSVKFNNGAVTPSSYGVVDSQGGGAEDIVYCGTYNNALSHGTCTFPWFTYNGTNTAVEFGDNYTGTTDVYAGYKQFDQTDACGPGTDFSQPLYCNKALSPTPPIP